MLVLDLALLRATTMTIAHTGAMEEWGSHYLITTAGALPMKK